MPSAPKVHKQVTPGQVCQPGKDAQDRAFAELRDWQADRERRGSAASRGYNWKWRKVRNRKLRYSPFCERCKENNHLTWAVEVHHIHPVQDTGKVIVPLEDLMSVCVNCHRELTAIEVIARRRQAKQLRNQKQGKPDDD